MRRYLREKLLKVKIGFSSFAADALTFASGPSATADIEMTRIRGIHGPRFLDVVLV